MPAVNETVADLRLLDALRATTHCDVYGPTDDGYDRERRTFTGLLAQSPGAIVVADTAADIQAAVRVAADFGLSVAVTSTGHGAHRPCDGGILISTEKLQGVEINPDRQTAVVQAGTRLQVVMEAAHKHGLTAVIGTSDQVAASGYLLGGGSGLLSRLHGWAAETIVAATIVTADGELRTIDAEHEPELLWGLRGTAGNFGVVTELEMQLFPHAEIYAGALLFPPERAREILLAYDAWTADLPETTCTYVALAKVPPPLAPPPFPDGRFVGVWVVHAGPAEEGADLLAPIRALGPIVDTVTTIPSSAIATIAGGSPGPMPLVDRSRLLDRLTPDAIDRLLAVAGPDSDSQLRVIQLRHLGGQVARATSADSPLTHPRADYLVLAFGLAFKPTEVEVITGDLDRLYAALADYDGGSPIPNGMGSGTDPETVQGAYDPESWTRLVALKSQYDPQNIFSYNHNIAPGTP